MPERYKSPYEKEKKVLVVASGMSAKQIEDYPYQKKGWCIVTVNNAWKATPFWKYAIADEMVKDQPTAGRGQKVILDSRTIISYFGGHMAVGFSMTMVTSYWSLIALKPKIIGYLGADMDYTPDANGHTHFYGIGRDVELGEPDPDKMVREHNIKKDPNFLNNLYMRFRRIAAKYDCEVRNFAKVERTRLPYGKASPEDFDNNGI